MVEVTQPPTGGEMINQKTISKKVMLEGTGLHTGKHCRISFKPAPEGTWYVFKRTDIGEKAIVEASVENAKDELIRGTVLEKNGVEVSTVEHVLAALYGLEIDNCLIELDGPEPPVLDGSALPFADILRKAGIEEQESPREYLKTDEVIQFSDASRKTDIHTIPFDGLRVTLMVDYANPALGTQYTTLESLEKEFYSEFASARTFCFLSEIEELREQGLIKGGNLDNAIVIIDKDFDREDEEFLRKNFDISEKRKIFAGKSGILNDTPLRFINEPVRHKVLDVLGDLALLGAFIKGHIIGARSGHSANVALVRLLRKKLEKQRLSARFGAKGAYLDINAIQKILPHRYPFLLVDRVIDFEAGKFAVGIKNVTFDEFFFQGHFPDHPVMPGVLIIEALAQTGGFLLMHTVADPENSVTYFVGVDGIRFKKPVVPGDQLVLRAEMLYFKRNICKFKGIATVKDEVVCEGEFIATVVPKE